MRSPSKNRKGNDIIPEEKAGCKNAYRFLLVPGHTGIAFTSAQAVDITAYVEEFTPDALL